MPAAALEFMENGDAYLGIVSRNPDLLSDIDPERVTSFRTADLKNFEKFYNIIMRDSINWSVISSPTKEWALKVFPDATAKVAVEKLWEAIFQTCRVDQPDPVAAWLEHIADLKKRSGYMNAKQLYGSSLFGTGHRSHDRITRTTCLAGGSNESGKRYRFYSQHAHRRDIYHAA